MKVWQPGWDLNLRPLDLHSDVLPTVLWSPVNIWVNSVKCKCPKISYTKISDKMAYANSADPNMTAPEGAVWSGSTLFAILISS